MIRTIPSGWQEAILVCGKCTKKVKGGFGGKGRTALAKALREAGMGGKGRKAGRGIVETGCLKLCPKNGVVVLDSARPERWLIVAPGTDLAEIAEQLGIGQPPG